MIMKKRVLKCMQNIGCEYDVSQEETLLEVFENSIMFITFIVELEKEFAVTIPDDYLMISYFQTIEDVCGVLDELVAGK